jgi:hypothetical protein
VDNVADTDSLINALHKDYPEFTKTKYVIAVDKQVIKENTALNKKVRWHYSTIFRRIKMSDQNLYERYHRQIILPEFGEEGQQKLLNAKYW